MTTEVQDQETLQYILEDTASPDAAGLRKLVEDFPGETATQILKRFDDWGELRDAEKKAARAARAALRKDGTKTPKKARPLNEPTRQLALFPAYRISQRGDVWGPRGTKLAVRWYKSIPHVVLYDHEGERHENRVYWLLVGAGWLKDPRTK